MFHAPREGCVRNNLQVDGAGAIDLCSPVIMDNQYVVINQLAKAQDSLEAYWLADFQVEDNLAGIQ
jgi:hypothetical protein